MIRLPNDTIALAKGDKGGTLSTACRYGFLLLVVTAFAASPAVAASKHKKSKEAAEAEEIAKQHDNTRRALRDALPLVLPTWSLPIYFSMHQDEKKDEKKKK